jgi:hypothetical protein
MLKDVSVNLNLSKKEGNTVRAFADVVLDFGEIGSVKLSGFRVLVPDGKPAWVSAPARHGTTSWFDIVTLKGQLKKLVDAAVLEIFEKASREAQEAK